MKIFIAIVLTVALASIGIWKVFYQSTDVSSEIEFSEHVDDGNEDMKLVTPSANLAEQNTDVELGAELADKPIEQLTLAERQVKAEQTKKKLDSLIAEYNDHLQDPEQRAATQARMNVLLEEYNELILPIALAKLDESN